MRTAVLSTILAATLVASLPAADQPQAPQSQQKPVRQPDILWVPTPDPVVDGMLQLAGVTKGDVVYDLGCGDGKIVIAAAKLGARGVGIDIDPARVEDATANVKKAGVQDRVQIKLGDIFDPKVTFTDATVVTLYLLTSLNEKLKPRLLKELKPGTRVVSHQFTMGDWKPDKTANVNGVPIYLWTIPNR